VDQRDRLEAAWQLAKALSLNPSDHGGVAEVLRHAAPDRAALRAADRSMPPARKGPLDTFAPQGAKIEEETIAPADPAPTAPAPH
jgi:hypothetical protein